MPSRARRPAAAAGIAAAAAVAVLGVLQQTVGAFNPRPVISAGIVVAAFLAGLTAARARARGAAQTELSTRAERLEDLLAVWPAPRARDAEPIALGVFPARRDVGSDPAYVDRRLDADLRAALVPGAVVLVVGEERAGASRTTLEAARAALPDAVVLAPRSAAGLVELAALDPPPRLGGHHVIVWLDGLDRFAEDLDGERLDALAAAAQDVTVLATVRREAWDAWVRADGKTAAAARAVVARARVFTLPAALDAEEAARARKRFPALDLAAGLGAALASPGRERAAPEARPVAPAGVTEPDTSVAAHRDPLLALPALGAAAALAVVLAVWAGSGFSTPSISDQLAKVRHDGSRDGRRVVTLATGDLHGSGATSHVLLFEDRPGTRRPRSDELRIYDEHGNSLVRAFRFAPAGRRATYSYRATADVDFDGASEVVGAFAYPDEARGAMVPFAIDWDEGAGRYRLVPLDLGPPRLSRPSPTIPERQYEAVYDAPTTFRDPADHLTLTGHRVQDFIVSATPRRFVAGWFLRPWLGPTSTASFELHTAILDASTGSPHLTPCRLTGRKGPLVATAGEDRAPMNLFAQAYTAATGGPNGADCTPVRG